MKVTAGAIFLELLLILSYLPLKAQVVALAAAEDATALDTTLGSLFPYLWIFLIIFMAGVIIWGAVTKK